MPKSFDTSRSSDDIRTGKASGYLTLEKIAQKRLDLGIQVKSVPTSSTTSFPFWTCWDNLTPQKLIRNLKKQQIVNLTPVQMQSVPLGTTSRSNLVIQAPPNSGKTVAAVVIAISNLAQSSCPSVAVLVVPSSYSANHLEKLCKRLVTGIDDGVAIKITRDSFNRNSMGTTKDEDSEKNTDHHHIIITTFSDIKPSLSYLTNVDTCIVDDTCTISKIDGNNKLQRVLQKLKASCQKILFFCSTTLDLDIDAAVRIQVKGNEIDNQQYHHKILWMETKKQWLFNFFTQNNFSKTIIFVKNNEAADMLSDSLKSKLEGKASVESLHVGKRARDIERLGEVFATGNSINVLVTTYVMAPGVHLLNVDCVILFDLPSTESDIWKFIDDSNSGDRSFNVFTLINDDDDANMLQWVYDHYRKKEKSVTLPRELLYKCIPEKRKNDRRIVAQSAKEACTKKRRRILL